MHENFKLFFVLKIKKVLINSIAVKQVTELNKPVTQVARDLAITYQTLCKWAQKYNKNQEEPFVGSGNLRSDDRAIRDMEKRLRDLEEEHAILKKGYGHICKRPEVIYRFIKQHQHKFHVAKMCQVLGESVDVFEEILDLYVRDTCILRARMIPRRRLLCRLMRLSNKLI